MEYVFRQLSSDETQDNLEPGLVPLVNDRPPTQVCSMIDRKTEMGYRFLHRITYGMIESECCSFRFGHNIFADAFIHNSTTKNGSVGRIYRKCEMF